MPAPAPSGGAQPVPPQPCPGCGATLPPATGPTHAYIGASPGCWALFSELSATGVGPAVPGQLVVDTYAIQHPGVPERRAIQSVCAHLVGVCAALERGWPAHRGPDLLRRALSRKEEWGWRWLDPTLPVGAVTLVDVLAADPPHRADRVREWSAQVWQAYRPHHGLVRSWVDDLLGPG